MQNEITLNINGRSYIANVKPFMPLLWVLRDVLKLTGTKYGCGRGICGCCTVHLNGAAIRSCSIPVAGVVGQNITTIEGLSENSNHPVQEAWKTENVPQCGYCQSGQIMSAVALIDQNPNPSEVEIETAMEGNLCRCGTYSRIKKAIVRASTSTKENS